MGVMSLNNKKLFGFTFLVLLVFFNTVSAQEEPMGMKMDGENADSMMEMGNPTYDRLNQISYPATVILALFSFWVCITLIKATGMKDKFGLIAAGLLMFLIQSIFGVLFYITSPDGKIISMTMLMFVMSFLTSVGLLLFGIAFYRWKKMVGG